MGEFFFKKYYTRIIYSQINVFTKVVKLCLMIYKIKMCPFRCSFSTISTTLLWIDTGMENSLI